MALLAVVGFLCTLPMMIKSGADTETIVDRSLDMFTICVPPAIPAALSCGVVFAVNRLKKSKIFCIAPKRVNLAGSVTSMVFDKTGTLTEEGLTCFGFRSAYKAKPEGLSDNEIILFSEFKSDAADF
jgi:cation-transporting ATPase 13A2